MQSERRQQEAIRVAGHQQGQMVVDALVQAEVGRQPIAGGEIDSGAALGVGVGRTTGFRLAFMRGLSDDDFWPSIHMPVTLPDQNGDWSVRGRAKSSP